MRAPWLFGIVAGALLAAMATSHNIVLKAIAAAFVWWFRGVPLLVQIFFWFNIALFVPADRIGRVRDLGQRSGDAAVAGFLALGLHEAANMAEIIRAGLRSVDQGQREAAQALGLGPLQTLWTVVMPQAVRLVIPPTGNQAIGMLKASAIVSVIGMKDLLTHGAADLRGELPGHRTAVRRVDLVPRDHHRGVHRPALSRKALRHQGPLD